MNAHNPPEPELLSERQAAALLGCSSRTLWRWSRSGICPAPVRLGHGPRAMVRFRKSDLLDWLENRCPAERRKGVAT